MSELQNIQWYPGHMTKTRRKMQESLKLVDAVAEIIDARIPISSRNPDIDNIIANKPRIILMNKCDMANENKTAKWIEYFKEKKITAIPVDCKTGKGLNLFFTTVRNLLSEKIEAWQAKGMSGKSVKIMVVGIPNVGKSSFINRMAGKERAKVEDRPGVTRGNQWFTIGRGFELLDTPGVLWPKFEDKQVGEYLAFTGAVKDQIIDTELLAVRLLETLNMNYSRFITERYKLKNPIENLQGYELLETIGKARGMFIKGGEIDTERTSIMVLDEFRDGKLGRITLENPPQIT
ncbi:MAG: ribosome biogenesis GTPase YlqF [Bacillota bacterium]|nr:ribosome biogenesis GTPase YlqF [Bacillota bacterium]